MGHPSTPVTGSVFISYRRRDASPYARMLHDEIARRLGEGQVFMDVDSIEVGVDFGEAIEQAVDECAVLLAVIGPQWLNAGHEDGRRRLDDPDDTVRLEIEAALARNIRVIPVLVDSARMPQRHQLPESLMSLARRNALELTHSHYRHDLARLIEAIDKATAARSPGRVSGDDRSGGRSSAPPSELDVDQVRVIAEEAVAAARSVADPTTRLYALSGMASVFVEAGEHDLAVVAAEASLAAARDCPDSESLVHWAARALVRAGRPAKAMAAASAIEDEFYRDSALGWVAQTSAATGDVDRAFASIGMISRDHHVVEFLAYVAEEFGKAERWEPAARAAQQAVATSDAISDEHYRSLASSCVATALAWAGDIDRALSFAAPQQNDGLRSSGLHAVVEVHLRRGNLRQALVVANDVPHRGWRAASFAVVADALVDIGDLRAAADVARRVLAAADATAEADKYNLARAAGLLARTGCADEAFAVARGVSDGKTRAAILAAVARGMAAAGDFDQAMQVCESLGGDQDRANALVGVAAAAVGARDTPRAVALLHRLRAGAGALPGGPRAGLLLRVVGLLATVRDGRS